MTDKLDWENKIPDTSGLVKKTNYNAKSTEVEDEIPSIICVATNFALTAVENKILNFSSLVKQTDYETKNREIEKKVAGIIMVNILDFNKFTAEYFDGRLKLDNLVRKINFDDKLSSLNQKINSTKTKHLLVEKELKKLKTFDSSYFHYERNGVRN